MYITKILNMDFKKFWPKFNTGVSSGKKIPEN